MRIFIEDMTLDQLVNGLEWVGGIGLMWILACFLFALGTNLVRRW